MFYIFLVAALNLALGFGLAVYLGRRYRATTAAGDPWSMDAPFGQPIGGVLAGEEETAAAVSGTAAGPPPGDVVLPEPPASPQADSPTDHSPGEISIEEFRGELRHYREEVARVDEKLRASAEAPDGAEIEAILSSFMPSTRRYGEGRDRAQRTLEELGRGQPGLGGISDALQSAVRRQDELIERTSAMTEGLEDEHDLEEGCGQMTDQTGKLIESSDQLAAVLDELLAKLGQHDRRPPEIEPAARDDTSTEVSGRADLEAELLRWWEDGPDRTGQLSLAMIDLDQFAQLQEQYSEAVVEKVLGTVTTLLESEDRGEGGLWRFSERRFLLRFPDADARSAADAAERLRQTIETTCFYHDETDVQVTVSCAVVEAASEETLEALIARAEATLQEARRNGHNRTFFHDGKCPTPVVPTEFSLEEEPVTV